MVCIPHITHPLPSNEHPHRQSRAIHYRYATHNFNSGNATLSKLFRQFLPNAQLLGRKITGNMRNNLKICLLRGWTRSEPLFQYIFGTFSSFVQHLFLDNACHVFEILFSYRTSQRFSAGITIKKTHHISRVLKNIWENFRRFSRCNFSAILADNILNIYSDRPPFQALAC